MQISVRGLTKIFGPHPAQALARLDAGASKDDILAATGHVVGLNRVSLDIPAGKTTVIMGLSGSGKSTLARCLNRLVEPTAGEILVDGRNIIGMPTAELREFRRKTFGMVFQQFALFPHYSVVQNVGFGLEVAGVSPAARREKAMDMLQRVGLEAFADAYPAELSGGMRQRVGLARALVLDPEVLIMDEAFSALDPLIRSDMQDELLRLQEELHKTIVFISHDLDEAIKLSDLIVLMRDGAVVQQGTAEDLLTSPADDYVARFANNADLTRVLTAGSIMKKSEAVAQLGMDGPRTALRKMRHFAITNLFVLDEQRQLVGILSADDALSLVEQGRRDIASIMKTDIVSVGKDTPASELISIMSGMSLPLAVVDERNHLCGVIVKGLLLSALAGKGGVA